MSDNNSNLSDFRARLRARGGTPVRPTAAPSQQGPDYSHLEDETPAQARVGHSTPAATAVSSPVVAGNPNSVTRFTRRTVDMNAQPSWEAWGLPDLDQPEAFGQFGQELPDNPTWRASSCVRCVRGNDHTPHLLVHSEGRFFCLQCGWHGNARTAPAKHMETWLDAFAHFLATTATVVQPEHATSFPAPFIPQEQATIFSGLVWDKQNSGWVNGWWLACYDRPDNLRAAWQALSRSSLDNAPTTTPDPDAPEQISTSFGPRLEWFRPRPMPACPMGTFWAFRTSEDNLAPPQAGVSHARTIYLTSHPEDYLSMVASGLDRVVCLPPDIDAALPNDTPWQFAEIWDREGNLIESDQLVMVVPSSSRSLEDELGRRLSRDRCSRVRYSSPSEAPLGEDEDDEEPAVYPSACSVYQDLGAGVLVDMVARASPFPVSGIHELDDMEEAFEDLYSNGLQPGHSTGFPSLDSLYTVVPGQWTLVTGIPGHGKSTWLDGVMINLARRYGWRFGVFSPENQPPTRYFAGLMEKLLDKPFTEGPTPRITPSEKNSAKRWLNDRFKIILPDEEGGEWSLDSVLGLARILVRRYGIQGLVIDPWNEMDHSAAGDKEVSYLSQALTKIRRFARLHSVHVWIVAHPTKLHKDADGMYPVPTPYDVAGGAHWRNKADNVVTVYRFVGHPDQEIADIHIQKIRFKEVGRVGIGHLRTNPLTNCWIDDVDYDRRMYNLDKGIRESYHSQVLPQPRVHPRIEEVEATADLL